MHVFGSLWEARDIDLRTKGRPTMKRDTKVRLAAFSAAALVLAGGCWLDTRLSLQASRQELEYVYQRALGDLAGHVAGMRATLEKAAYVGTASTRSAVSAKLLEQSSGAKAAMAALPFSQEKAEGISRFLSQAGDYALALNRKTFSGAALEQSDVEGLYTLEEYAGKLAEALAEIQARLKVENVSLLRTESLLNNLEEPDALSYLDDSFDAVAQEFAGLPTLLYDGPFSDHISRRKPLALEAENPVDIQRARKEAAGFLGVEEEEVESSGEGGGQLPVYSFTAGDAMVNITKQGGRVAYYRKASAAASARLTAHEAVQSAKEILSRLGYQNMRESYYVVNDNLCAINFHSVCQQAAEEVLCYPDLVKVVVELEQGGAVEVDCSGYLMNHRSRNLPAPKYGAQQAEESLSPLLKAQSVRLAVIPSPGLDELLCWEFHCTSADGKEFLSYINAGTGQEEQLYILRKDDHGVLAV